MQRILLVDDHPLIRQGLRTMLEGYDDVIVIAEAGNGVEAVSIAAEMRPDTIVMDINMPSAGVNGDMGDTPLPYFIMVLLCGGASLIGHHLIVRKKQAP